MKLEDLPECYQGCGLYIETGHSSFKEDDVNGRFLTEEQAKEYISLRKQILGQRPTIIITDELRANKLDLALAVAKEALEKLSHNDWNDKTIAKETLAKIEDILK